MSDEDLALARRSAQGDAAAIAEIERRADASVRSALARLRLDAAEADEVRQAVREKLFVGGAEKGPAIASYEGKGPLEGFLRAVVVHAALSAKRRVRPADGDSVLAGVAVEADPALDLARAKYGASFAQAFRDAFQELTTRERNILRLVYVDGLSVEQVATTYGVHRVSASRWLGTARGALQERTHALLRERLAVGPSEAASLVRLCLVDLDVSLARLL